MKQRLANLEASGDVKVKKIVLILFGSIKLKLLMFFVGHINDLLVI